MLTYGVWPGVSELDLVTLTSKSVGPPEDPARALAAMASLFGDRPHHVRAYRHWTGRSQPGHATATPVEPMAYAGGNALLDLVCCYQASDGDAAGFGPFVRQAVTEIAAFGGGKVQVTEEINVGAPLDGGSPGCWDALVVGLGAAYDAIESLAPASNVAVGFNLSAPLPGAECWTHLAQRVPAELLSRVDYVGIDLFPDVFRPAPLDDVPAAVEFMLTSFRGELDALGIPSGTPMHLTETGWPTGPDHSEEQQADTVEAVAEAVAALAGEVGLEAYEFFGLRDSCSSADRWFRFGLLRDDWSSKPAFDRLREVVARQG